MADARFADYNVTASPTKALSRSSFLILRPANDAFK
jgi:hypothetical protein